MMQFERSSKIQETEPDLAEMQTDASSNSSAPTEVSADDRHEKETGATFVVRSDAQTVLDSQAPCLVYDDAPAQTELKQRIQSSSASVGSRSLPYTQDEICLDYNPSRTLEKTLQRASKYELSIRIALGGLLVLLIASAGFWDVVEPFLALLAVFAAVALDFHCSRPKLCLSKQGLRFKFNGIVLSDHSSYISWDKLSFVDATDALATSGEKESIDLCFSDASFTPLQLLTMPLIYRGWIRRSKSILHLYLRASDLGVEDRQRLRQALLKYAKPEAISIEAQKLLNPTDPSTYTALWLDSLSALPTRLTSDLLEPGATVSNGRYSVVEQLASGGQATIYKAIDHQADQDNHENASSDATLFEAAAPGVKQNSIGSSRRDSNAEAYESCSAEQEHPDSELRIVLKEFVLPTNAGVDVCTRALKNIEKEAELLRKIAHPQVVQLRDFFVEDHRGYLVMQYLSGQSLRMLVDREGPLQESTVRNIGKKMVQILHYLHTLTPPVVHRDFTPENLMLTDEGELILIDFNVAQELEGGFTRTIVGTHSYIPPEQFRGEVTTQSDIYAFGATLYFLLTGEEPEPISQSHPQILRPEVSEHLDNIVAGCTALDLNERYRDAQTVLHTLCRQE